MAPLAWLLLATTGWAALTWFFRRAGAWLPYYVLGAAGGALILVVASREVLPLEYWLRWSTAHSVNVLARPLGIFTQVDRSDPGALLVLGVRHDNQWTRLSIGLESSGLLECAALLGLLIFFPARRSFRRAAVVIGALAATFAANVLRILLIVFVVAYAGQGGLNFAHVVLGRLVFFVLAILIYWFAITRPTLRIVAARLREA